MAKRILVVDDEPDVVAHLCAVLRDGGYETLEAFNGEGAMEKVLSERPDLITLDISMPRMTGVRAYRTLKEDRVLCGIPVIIVTGVSSEFRRFISTRTQVPPPDGYIQKPIEVERLLGEVKRLIG
ncbi:MAG: response regulator [Acidobacteriota bacterium]